MEVIDGAVGIFAMFDSPNPKWPTRIHAMFTPRSLDSALTNAAFAATEVAEKKRLTGSAIVTKIETPSIIASLLIAQLILDAEIESLSSPEMANGLLGLTELSEPNELRGNRYSFHIGGVFVGARQGANDSLVLSTDLRTKVSQVTLAIDEFGLATVSSN